MYCSYVIMANSYLFFFNKRIGILLPLIINCMLPLAISPLSNTNLWFLIPYSWVSKSMKSIIGLDVNGTMTTVSSKDSLDFTIGLLLSVLLFIITVIITAKKFREVEG